MDRIKLSENFFLDEFLDKETYENLMFIHRVACYIRQQTGQPVRVNNWATGGQYNYSGFRPPQCTVGSLTSEHRKMNAADFKIGNWTGRQMQTWAKQHAKDLYYLGVRRMEDEDLTPTWLHLDGKEHGQKAIIVIDLKNVVEKIYV